MENRDKFPIMGKIKLIKRNKHTRKIIKEKIIHNRIMDNALDEIIKTMYLVTNSDMYIKYIAIGDSDAAIANDQETLDNEIYRVPVITRLKIGTGEFRVRAILNDTQPEDLSGACTIKEIGVFAGESATQWADGVGKDTGLMISRIVLTTPEAKTDDEEIEMSWEYEISRA